MKKILLSLALATSLLLTTIIPVFAGEGSGLKIGDKVVLANDAVAEFLGKQPDGQYLWKATIGDVLYCDDLTTPIDSSWYWDTEKKQYESGANLYEAIVKDIKVTVTYKGKQMSWQPDIFIGTKKQSVTVASLMHPVTSSFVDPINENYIGNTLYWEYGDIIRSLRIIEGMLLEYYTIDSLPTGDIRINSNEVKDIGFDYVRPQTAYDADNNIIPLTFIGKDLILTFEDMAEAIFPITIDPDTSFTTSSNDCDWWLRNAVYATSHDSTTAWFFSNTATTVDVGQSYAGGNYNIWRAGVFFNTAALPDGCSVSAATLDLRWNSNTTNNAWDIVIQSGMPTYPSIPSVTTDCNYTYYSSDGGSLSGQQTGGYHSITLNATGRGWINKEGWTKFMLRSSEDIADAYDTINNATLYTYEQGDGYRPKLEVTYAASAAPTISTDAASDIAKTTARLNSTIIDDGGGFCQVRWGYGESSEATIEAYDHYTALEGAYSTGEHPYYDASGLTANTLHYFRVESTNDAGTTLGGELQFTTLSAISDPTDFRAYPQATFVNLSWTKNSGATQSLVRFAVNTYPTAVDEGTQIYLGTSSNTTHSDLTPGKTYYYSVWGESGGSYSTNYDTAITTTSAVEVTGDDFDEPLEPGRWLSAPNYSNLSGMPFYSAVNSMAVSLGMPEETLWLGLAIVLAVGVGLGVYLRFGKSAIFGLIAMTIALAIGWAVEIVPFWIPLMALLIIIGLLVGRREVAA